MISPIFRISPISAQIDLSTLLVPTRKYRFFAFDSATGLPFSVSRNDKVEAEQWVDKAALGNESSIIIREVSSGPARKFSF
jgi:hypothetical protein